MKLNTSKTDKAERSSTLARMADPVGARYIQLTRLPNLKEVDHVAQETSADKILARAIALQLKPLNAEITKFAFDHLLTLIDDQLDDMIGQLHRISNIQRRESIAKGDIQLFLQGFNISPSDLDVQGQFSQFISSNFKKEYDLLHSLKESYSGVAEDETEQIENVLTALVPPTNSLKFSIPRWFPALPPDHTYKFTPQFNHPITDEVTIRKKVVEEGKKSELALLHLLNGCDETEHQNIIPDFDAKLAAEETTAIYGLNTQKQRRGFSSTSSVLINKVTTNAFDVEAYARARVELARRRVLEYEEGSLKLEKNPFLKASRLLLSSPNDRINKRQVNREIKGMLKRSFGNMLRSIPGLLKQKTQAREQAVRERKNRLEEMTISLEQKEKEKNEKVKNGEINLLDLEHQDEFFENLDSSDDESQALFQSQPEAQQQPQLESNTQSQPLDALSPTLGAESPDTDSQQPHLGHQDTVHSIPAKEPESDSPGKVRLQDHLEHQEQSEQGQAGLRGPDSSGREGEDDFGFLLYEATETKDSSYADKGDSEI